MLTEYNSSMSEPMAAIIGTADEYGSAFPVIASDLNELVQLTAERFTVPQVSFESHSTVLSNAKMYPLFSRMSASQDLVAISLLKIIDKYQ